METISHGYTFKGFAYNLEEDQQDDCIKFFHDILKPDGKLVAIQFSPYREMTRDAFEAAVEAL